MNINLEKLQKTLDMPAILSSGISQRWVSDFAYTDGNVIVTPDRAWLVCDFRYIEAAKEETAQGIEVLLNNRNADFYHNFFKENGIKKAYLEDRFLTKCEYDRICAEYPETEFYPLGDKIEKLRAYKTKEEVEKIVKAQRIAERALDYVLGIITPEKTEIEIALELEFKMRSLGAEGIAFETICVSGENSSKPHGVPGDKKIGHGFLTMDFGAIYKGYLSDMTRTVCVGKADDEMRKMYDTVYRAQAAGIDLMNPGENCSAAHIAAAEIIDSIPEYKGAFGHGFGHSVGMEIHEMPVCSPRSKDILKPGIVMTAEPGIYLAGKYGVRIEDMILITEDGHENLTKANKELIEL